MSPLAATEQGIALAKRLPEPKEDRRKEAHPTGRLPKENKGADNPLLYFMRDCPAFQSAASAHKTMVLCTQGTFRDYRSL